MYACEQAFSFMKGNTEIPFENHQYVLTRCDGKWNFRNGTECGFSYGAKASSGFVLIR
jgi:hypothetical protein